MLNDADRRGSTVPVSRSSPQWKAVGMHALNGAGNRSGRLHGRLLQILGVVSVVAGLIALWQFDVFGDEPERDPVGAIDGLETPAISGAAEDTSTAESTPTISATASPSESTAAETSDAPTSEAAESPRPAPTTTAAADDDEEQSAESTGCSATLELTKSWEDSIEVSVEVVNTGGEEIGSWEIDLGLDGATIEHFWSMRHIEGDRYGNEGWNGRLDPDENAVTGFQAEVGRNFELPDSVFCTAGA
jgi:hypothetical protein